MRKKNVHLPAWLDQTPIPANPWTSRAEFRKDVNSPQMRELRQFMLDTVAEQTQFLVARAQGAMEKILKTTPDGTEREHIVIQFTRVIRASENFYPLIDYINFKGEGTNPNEAAMNSETGRSQGWGLKQVLLRMNGVPAIRRPCAPNSPMRRSSSCSRGFATFHPTVSSRSAGCAASRPTA